MFTRIREDVRSVLERDPAARSRLEVFLCYPGLWAVWFYRVSHQLWLMKLRLLARVVSQFARLFTGVDIHPGALLGRRLFIDHGTGVVIGETAIVGDRVRLYQGVTLGAKSFPLDARGQPVKGIPRHPIVEDDVVIYAGATILGRITIGKGSSIGGNVWLTRDVPPGSRVTQAEVLDERHTHGSGI